MSAAPKEDARITLLLDTNVWLDYYLGWRRGHAVAAELITRACETDADLLYAAVTSKDVYYLIAAELKRQARAANAGALDESAARAAGEAAWACVEHLDEIATVVGCDLSDLWLARKQRILHADYEDDLVIAAALRANPTCLVTSDEALLRHAPVAALCVEDAAKLFSTTPENPPCLSS